MKITKVTSSGITRLINAYKASMNSQTPLKFSAKQAEFFENMEISLFLSDVKGIELITLRKWCSSLYVIDNNGLSFRDKPATITNAVLRSNQIKNENDVKRERDLSRLSEKIPSLEKYIRNKNPENLWDQDVDSIDSMYDIGSFRFKVLARFEGVNIMALLNAFPEYLLYVKGKRNEFIEEGTKAFENLCASQFIKNFFSYMETMLSGIDVLSDVRFNEEFLKYTNTMVPCVCTHIRNPLTELSMSSYTDANELIRDMKLLKTEASFMQYNIDVTKDFTYHFAVESSMETFLAFLAYTNLVYYHSDLKAIIGVKSKYDIPSFLSDEMKIVYNDAIVALDTWRLDALKELSAEEKADNGTNNKKNVHYSRLELYNFIPRAAKIKYMLHGTEKEFNEALSFIRNEKELLLLNPEIKTIFNLIDGQFPLIHAVDNMV